MADDGYGEFGGNGSVEWKVDVNRIDFTVDTPKGGGVGRRQGGRDPLDTTQRFFRVYVEPPRVGGLTPTWKVESATSRIYFELPIERDNPDQIRVAWAFEQDANDRVLATQKVT